MTELLRSQIARGEDLAQDFVGLVALGMIVAVWLRTKAFVPTLGALLFGVFVTWAVHNVEFLETKVDQEFQSLPAVTVTLPGPVRA